MRVTHRVPQPLRTSVRAAARPGVRLAANAPGAADRRRTPKSMDPAEGSASPLPFFRVGAMSGTENFATVKTAARAQGTRARPRRQTVNPRRHRAPKRSGQDFHGAALMRANDAGIPPLVALRIRANGAAFGEVYRDG